MSKNFKSHFHRGTQLLHQGKVEEAIPYLQSAHKIMPKDIDTAINLSGALILLRKFKKALQLLEPYSQSHPGHAMVWINLGAAYLGNPVLARDADQMRAISAFRRALEIDPVAPSVAYNIGLIYEDRNEIDVAIGWFEKAIEANPQDTHAHRKVKRLRESVQEEE